MWTSESNEAVAASPPSAGRLGAAWPYALILAVGLFILLPALGGHGFWDPWEPKYAESAREMYQQSSYIVPIYREEVRLTKPILVYWGVLAGSFLFGFNEVGARVGGVAMALGSMLGVYYAVSRLRGRQAGLLAALVLGTTAQFYLVARQATPDVYLFTSLGSCFVFLGLGRFGPDRRRDLHYAISYACFALAVLAKGPVITGVIFFVSLAVFELVGFRLERLWQSDLRRETLRFAGAGAGAAVLLAACAMTAFLFGTSPTWWGYSEEGRRTTALFRLDVLHAIERLRLDLLLPILIGVGILAVAGRLFARRGSHARARPALIVALASVGLLALSLPAASRQSTRILLASLVGASTGALVLVAVTRRFLRLDPLQEAVRPYLRGLRRQALLFGAVVLLIAGPWHVAINLLQGHAYFTDFIIKHNVERAREVINSSGLTDFYVRTLIFGYFPWSCFIPIAMACLVPWWNAGALKKYGLEVFLLVVSVVSFTAFTLPATKFGHYLAVMIIPLAVLIGLAIDRLLSLPFEFASRLGWIVASMLFLLPANDLVRDVGIEKLVGTFTVKQAVPGPVWPGAYFNGIVVVLAVLLLASILVRSRVLVGGMVLAAALLGNYANGTFVPALSRYKSMRNICETWKAHRQPGRPLGFQGPLKHGVFFYTENQIAFLITPEQFERFMNPEIPSFCVVQKKEFRKLDPAFSATYPGHRLRIIENSHLDYLLIANHPVAGVGELTEGDIGQDDD